MNDIYDGNVKMSEIDDIFTEIDLNANSKIDYTEWLVAATDKQIILTEENLSYAFQYYNSSGSGYIDLPELKEGMNIAMQPEEDERDEVAWEDLLAEFDMNQDNLIDYDEFIFMMNKILNDK